MNERTLGVLAVVLALGYGMTRAWHASPASVSDTPHTAVAPPSAPSPRHFSTRDYLIDVILNGSSRLRFKPTETMPGALASKEDAPAVAQYVLRLRGEAHDERSADQGAAIFSSNCAGCHGDDGKGLDGTYPDLTRKPLLGMQR